MYTYTRAYTYPRRGLSRMINDGAETTAGVGRVVPAEPELFLIRCCSSLPPAVPLASRPAWNERLTNQPQR